MVADTSASPKAVVMEKCFVSIISGCGCANLDLTMCVKYKGKLLVAISLGDVWDISRIRLLGQSVLAF